MFNAISLASGSGGNSLLVSTEKTKILLDAGTSVTDICRKLRYLKIEPEDMDGILLTHEHNDHSMSAVDLSKKFSIPVYANNKTLKRLSNKKQFNNSDCKAFTTNEIFKVGGFAVKSIPISHDAVDPVGFTIGYRHSKIAYFVDVGRINNQIQSEINSSNLVIIDSNYDRLSLLKGKYPPIVKQRIVNGAHLSNETVANLILNHPNKRKTEFWLAHLSEENNSPELASITINHILKQSEVKHRVNYKILPRKRLGPTWMSLAEKQLSLFDHSA